MRVGVSNIAWDIAEDEEMAKLFQKEGVDAIDIAPGKYFPDPARATRDEILKVKQWWQDRGIAITGMQSLLFGTTGLNVFGSDEVQNVLLQRLEAIFKIAGILGSKRLVFGSPKNRDVGILEPAEVQDIAFRFFQKLGDLAATNDVTLSLEPNPPVYGCNFMTNSAETAAIVGGLNHPAVRMQFDTGAIAINREDPQEILAKWSHLIGHVHVSEPALAAVGTGSSDHRACAEALRKYLPHTLVTIEMVATPDEAHLTSIGRAVAFTKAMYQG